MVDTVSLSGRQALGSINQTLVQLQQEISASEQQIEQLNQQLIESAQLQSENYQSLARLRLDQITAGAAQQALQLMDQRVQTLLSLRIAARKKLQSQIEALDQQTIELEQQRAALEDRLSDVNQSLEQTEIQLVAQLESQPDYQQQQGLSSDADRVADHAEEKLQDARQNRLQKGLSYEQDPLFSYLWARQYGTSEYRANALFRFLDRWVAKLIHYQASRPNYAMLLEIPLRLQAHAERLRANADAQWVLLEQLQSEASEGAGLPALQQKVSDLQQQIEEIDSQIEQVVDQRRVLSEQVAVFISGEDSHFQQAVEAMQQTLEKENIEALYQRARLTPEAEDDQITLDISAQKQQYQQIAANIEQLKQHHSRHLIRLDEMQTVRRNFKQSRFDEPRSGFANKALLLMVLNEFLKGVASSSDVWDTLRREQRRRPPKGSQASRRGGAGPWSGNWGDTGSTRHSPWGGRRGASPAGRRSRGKTGGFRTGGGF